jgi:tRNA-Thr(GGU) m(6)t(6)A37 methyltransferase TsaA
MQTIEFKPIGIINSPFKEPKGTPIQPKVGDEAEGTIEVFSEFTEGLKDLDGFSYIVLIYHFHRSSKEKASLLVIPFMDDQYHGVFSTRAPKRPNSIGLSIVRLTKVEGSILHIKELDMLDQTPLLDIKPYTEAFDKRENIRIGWLENNIGKMPYAEDDGRFSE